MINDYLKNMYNASRVRVRYYDEKNLIGKKPPMCD